MAHLEHGRFCPIAEVSYIEVVRRRAEREDSYENPLKVIELPSNW